MEKNNNKPKLRFPGFTDPWEQRKFGEIGTVQTCKRIFKEQTSESGDIPFYKNGTLGLKADAYISREVYEKYKELYPYPRVGDVLMSVVGSIGRTAEYKGNAEYFQDSNIVWLKTDNNIIDKTFLKISYQIIDWLIEGSTIKHLYNDNILASKIWIPSSIDEQKSIGGFFYFLDNLITLHQRKLNHLQDKKKSLLQKMFPKNGEDFPELRFPKFTDPWEQRKFGELFTEYREKSIVENEDVLLSCAINGMFLNSELFSHQRGQSNIGYLKIKKYDLILSAQNLHLGNVNVNFRFEHGIISPAYKVFSTDGCSPEFVGAWAKKDDTKNFFLAATTEGASVCRKNIEWETLYRKYILVPKITEQEAIGTFFQNFDNLITLHQRKLNHLKEQKKALLQQMFV